MRLIRCFLYALCALWLTGGVLAADPAEPEEQSEETEEVEAEPDKPKRWYKNIVPIPIIITEPAIGEGLGLAVGYFHPVKSPETGKLAPVENPDMVLDSSLAPKPPPTVTGVFGGATNNGTWVAGAGHMNTFRDDTIRYLGAAAYASVYSNFYVFDRPFEFNLEGYLIYQDVKFRLGKSNWFMGVGLSFLDGTNTFKLKPPERGVPEVDGFLAADFRDVGIKGRLMYETRDDSMMPSKGQLFDLELESNDDYLSGDYDYDTVTVKFLSFHPLGRRFVVGLRGEYSTVSGDPPFYAIPWVTMRGIPAMRYQGTDVTAAEVEGRYNFNENWAAIAFYGRGWTDIGKEELETEDRIRAYGVGGRWRALKDQGVWVGIDLARGPEDTVYYIQVGHAW